MCNHLRIKEREVAGKYWIHYVSKIVLKEENNCDLICSQTQQEVCTILNVFDKYKIAKEKEIEKRRIERLFNKK